MAQNFSQSGVHAVSGLPTVQVQICNLALSRIGVSKYLTLISDNTNEASVCRRVWDNALLCALTAFPWAFAKRQADLVDLALVMPETARRDPTPGWGYTYAYPSDCLFLRDVRLPSQVIQVDTIFPPSIPDINLAWEVMEDEGYNRKVINTHFGEAVAVYTAYVQNVNLWDPLFKDALAWGVAAELAGPLVAEPQRQKVCIDNFNITIHRAAARSMNESRAMERESDLISGRR